MPHLFRRLRRSLLLQLCLLLLFPLVLPLHHVPYPAPLAEPVSRRFSPRICIPVFPPSFPGFSGIACLKNRRTVKVRRERRKEGRKEGREKVATRHELTMNGGTKTASAGLCNGGREREGEGPQGPSHSLSRLVGPPARSPTAAMVGLFAQSGKESQGSESAN